MERGLDREIIEKIACLEKEIQELEAEKKANDRRILELTEREIKNRELHTKEIHGLRQKNFEISFQILTKRNHIKKLRYYPPDA